MGSRIQSHQLRNGLYVSGRPENPSRERPPTMASSAVPYTGGDIKKSKELGKMLNIPNSENPPQLSRPSRSGSGPLRSGSASGSGRLPRPSHSGKLKKYSGPLPPLQPTGLITSGPLGSSSSSNRRSGQLDPPASMKAGYGPAVTSVTGDAKMGFAVSKLVIWMFLVAAAMGFLVGAFLMVAVKKVVILLAVAVLVGPVAVLVVWNCFWRKRGVLGFVKRYPDAELRGATDGQHVKVTGVVTCGSIPLETSYQKVPRCVYVSTELYEYKGFGGKSEDSGHHCFSWGCRHSEKYVADFYISDFQSGLRALVKAGYGAKVAPFVKPATVVDITTGNRDLSPDFLHWLAERKLSSDDRRMRLEEGYIKEGSTVSVTGIVRRHENVLMIVPAAEALSTGCQWVDFLLPTYVEGLILSCDDSQNDSVVPV